MAGHRVRQGSQSRGAHERVVGVCRAGCLRSTGALPSPAPAAPPAPSPPTPSRPPLPVRSPLAPVSRRLRISERGPGRSAWASPCGKRERAVHSAVPERQVCTGRGLLLERRRRSGFHLGPRGWIRGVRRRCLSPGGARRRVACWRGTDCRARGTCA